MRLNNLYRCCNLLHSICRKYQLIFLAAELLAVVSAAPAEASSVAPARVARPGQILVVGSINMDTIIDVQRLPRNGETITTRHSDTGKSVPGGKGANQAVAVARLTAEASHNTVQFVCQLGNDAHAKSLEEALVANGVDISASSRTNKPSGQGLVFLLEDGTVSSVVIGGSNAAWPADLDARVLTYIRSASAVMLQREVPDHVNYLVASAAHAANVPVFQDMGGSDQMISGELLAMLTMVTPNLSELERTTGMPVTTEEEILDAARSFQARGAKDVLVTRGEDGAILLTEDGQVLKQHQFTVEQVIDETGAGDSFRAAFTVAYVEGRPLQECLQFASAAGAAAVTVLGAFPSLPSRRECNHIQQRTPSNSEWLASKMSSLRTNVHQMGQKWTPRSMNPFDYDITQLMPVPKLASRLNSMKAHPSEAFTDDVSGWIHRQGTVEGLDLVDFNFPQHFSSSPNLSTNIRQMQAAAAEAGLVVGGVSIRFPDEFRNGAFTNPDPELRRRAVNLTIEGGEAAIRLGAKELVVWSAYDGYDYVLQADYTAAWQNVIDSFRAVCSALPSLRVMIEYKPSDAATRFSIAGSAAAALLVVKEVGQANMGVMLDLGHSLMAGENPAQSVALLGPKLFGVHLNDGYPNRAEDGLMVGTVNPRQTVELLYWLQRINYQGHLYIDTFPLKEDPVRECEFNVRRVKVLWREAQSLRHNGLDAFLANHDALGALEFMEQTGNMFT